MRGTLWGCQESWLGVRFWVPQNGYVSSVEATFTDTFDPKAISFGLMTSDPLASGQSGAGTQLESLAGNLISVPNGTPYPYFYVTANGGPPGSATGALLQGGTYYWLMAEVPFANFGSFWIETHTSSGPISSGPVLQTFCTADASFPPYQVAPPTDACHGSAAFTHNPYGLQINFTPQAPVPLPAAVWLLLFGLGGVGATAHALRGRRDSASNNVRTSG